MMESDGRSDASEDMMRHAWIVETVIVALVFMLIGRGAGIPISLYSLLIAFVLASLVIAGLRVIRKRNHL